MIDTSDIIAKARALLAADKAHAAALADGRDPIDEWEAVEMAGHALMRHDAIARVIHGEGGSVGLADILVSIADGGAK